MVLGFPCNQFGKQEPGHDLEIQKFCKDEYAVSFPLFSKIEVNGPDTHALYWCCSRSAQTKGLLGTEAIKWNFTKFLVGKDGQVIKRYAPADAPAALAKDIEKALATA